MAYQEAIERSSRILLDHIEKRSGANVTLSDYLKDCNYAAGIFRAQAEHLEVTSVNLQDQAIDLLININRSLKNG